MQHDQQVDEVQSLMLKWMENRLLKSVKLEHSSYKFILRSPIQDNYFVRKEGRRESSLLLSNLPCLLALTSKVNLRRKLKILFFALFYFFLLIRLFA